MGRPRQRLALTWFRRAPRGPCELQTIRERFAKLESRRSADGREQWLNWVIRLPSAELAGYVQATVRQDGFAGIAYELASAYWGRGLARTAVEAMIGELTRQYRVRRLTAVLKRDNYRSMRLLERLGFSPAPPDLQAGYELEPEEAMMYKRIG